MNEWQLTVETLGLRAALPVMLRVLPLDRTLRTLTRWTEHGAARTNASAHVQRVERVTNTWTRHVPGLRTACLKRALMRYVLLRRGGQAASFVIGVRAGGPDGFEAHAWVTLRGAVVMEDDTNSYRQTLVWPREAECAR